MLFLTQDGLPDSELAEQETAGHIMKQMITGSTGSNTGAGPAYTRKVPSAPGGVSADDLKDNYVISRSEEAGTKDHFISKNRSNKLTKSEFSFDSSPLSNVSI